MSSETIPNLNSDTNPTRDKFYPWSFTGRGGEYFFLLLSNALLSIITLGIYAAWAKVRRNRYLYGHTRIAGEAFVYHATGLMIFKGRLIVLAVLFASSSAQLTNPFFSLLPTAIVLLALPWIINQSLSFRARMLSWHNVHFRWHGTTMTTLKALWPFLAIIFLFFIFSVFILSVSAGANSAEASFASVSQLLDSYLNYIVVGYIAVFFLLLWGNFIWARYASTQFSWGNIRLSSFFDTWDYFRVLLIGIVMFLVLSTVLITMVLIIIAFGSFSESLPWAVGFTAFIVFALYIVLSISTKYMIRHMIVSRAEASRVTSQQSQTNVAYFYSNIQWMKTLWFHGQNALAIILSLGFLYPWVVVRTQRYLAERTAIVFVEDMSMVVDDTQKLVSSAASEYADFDGVDIAPW